MSLTVDQVIPALLEYVRETDDPLDLILVGGLALQAYGLTDRVTRDVDGELVGDVHELATFLRKRRVPADLGENMSGWSVVAMPPGYRERATVFHEEANLRVRLLAPTDFVIAKLRRGTDQDLDDAEFVADTFHVSASDVRTAAERAVAVSSKDTTLFLFNQTVEVFCRRLLPDPPLAP